MKPHNLTGALPPINQEEIKMAVVDFNQYGQAGERLRDSIDHYLHGRGEETRDNILRFIGWSEAEGYSAETILFLIKEELSA